MKKFLSLVLALVMTMSLVTVSAGAKDFTDDSKITYSEAVDVMSEIGVIDGYADGSFNPTATLTRGAAAKIICNLILGPTTANALAASAAPFTDVPADSTFAGYIAYCAKEGIVGGYADGTFKPGNSLTGYAFMKMLLGALGYDASVEGYNDANWSIAVAKRALNIGLDDGLVTDFNGTKAVTREEACLYALNTLKSDMVEYDNNSSITVGNIVITNSTKAVEVELKYGDPKDGMIYSNDQVMQFAEKYFPKLKVVESSDEFERPADLWTYKSKEIGTYAYAPDATYTAEVESGDLYKDLGLSATDSYKVYVDGVLGTSSDYSAIDGSNEFSLIKGEDDKKLGGNGVLVEAYKDAEKICIINTYVGEVVAVEEATAKKDAYVTVDFKGTDYAGILTSGKDQFDTEAFAEDDIVLFTYTKKSGDEGIQSLKKAESVSGEVTKYTSTKNFVIDGTTYKYSAKKGATVAKVDVERVAYLDEYGYVIYVDDSEVTVDNLAFVLQAGKDSLRGGTDKWAELLYTDGTTAIVTTSKVYGDDANGQTSGDCDDDLAGKFVSYKTNASGKVVLSEAAGYAVNATGTSTTSASGGVKVFANGKSSISKLNVSGAASANSKTLFLYYSEDDGEAKVYTGIKNAPDVTVTTTAAKTAALAKTGKAAAIVLIYVDDATTSNEATEYLFLRGANVQFTEDSDDVYYEFDAILDGEITKVKLEANSENDTYVATLLAKTNVLATNYVVDGDLYTIKDANDSTPDGAHDGAFQTATSISKISGDVISVNGTGYTVADDLAIYKISASGKISVASASALRAETVGTYFQQVTVSFNEDDEITAIYLELN